MCSLYDQRHHSCHNKVTRLLLESVPFIKQYDIIISIYITVEQYAAAGGLATETLNAIRTVTALNAQPDVINRYRVFLFKAMQVIFTHLL